ncbi:hypothetical protein H4Q26_004350 [Puccinia striiformis f. sp. tritici PST-130]|nr:hypothetical protein H4Q26_004350 [Puccinia striiformis f. sp. tritici PST-130]
MEPVRGFMYAYSKHMIHWVKTHNNCGYLLSAYFPRVTATRMKRKRTSPQKQTATSSSSTSTTNRTLSQPESPDVIEIDVEDANKQPQSVRRSWVWLHFEEMEDWQKAVCQVIMKNNQKCGSTLKKDRSSSTKNFHDHLEKVHKLIDPKASKKVDKSQTDLARWAKSGKVAPKVNFQLLNGCYDKFSQSIFLTLTDPAESRITQDRNSLLSRGGRPLIQNCRKAVF